MPVASRKFPVPIIPGQTITVNVTCDSTPALTDTLKNTYAVQPGSPAAGVWQFKATSASGGANTVTVHSATPVRSMSLLAG
jgi:hypothetical protein